MSRLAHIAALALASIIVDAARASELSVESACAAYDIHLFSLIEESGENESMTPDALFAAFVELVDARNACKVDGTEGLRRYEAISVSRLHPVFRKHVWGSVSALFD